jgi:hypothetical protein
MQNPSQDKVKTKYKAEKPSEGRKTKEGRKGGNPDIRTVLVGGQRRIEKDFL